MIIKKLYFPKTIRLNLANLNYNTEFKRKK
jgi:hypothetical protein